MRRVTNKLRHLVKEGVLALKVLLQILNFESGLEFFGSIENSKAKRASEHCRLVSDL